MADSKKYNGSTWEHSLRKLTTATEAVENPLYSDSTAITSYTIKGNTVQDGTPTPTPSNPVDVNGVGVRTENLFDTRGQRLSSFINSTGNVVSDPTSVGWISSGFIEVTAGAQYTFNPNSTEGLTAKHFFYDANKIGISGSAISSGKRTFIVPTGAKYAKFSYRDTSENIMLNTGSTALPYEPYGQYKIPISSGQQTTNIYLGSTQTVRAIKKLVLDGTENWARTSTDETHKRYQLVISDILPFGTRLTPMFCTHYQNIFDGRSIGDVPDNSIYLGQNQDAYIKTTSITSLTDFKAYLATQYAAGTPVTIWYVLATPETATVNEPLMKIGDYVDTLSNATAIPTIEGANSITVDTTVQPSEFTATWTGWHDSSVKEWDGSQWNE